MSRCADSSLTSWVVCSKWKLNQIHDPPRSLHFLPANAVEDWRQTKSFHCLWLTVKFLSATMHFCRREKLRNVCSRTIIAVISTVGISGVVCFSSDIPVLEVICGSNGTNYSHVNWIAFNFILFEPQYYTSDTVQHISNRRFSITKANICREGEGSKGAGVEMSGLEIKIRSRYRQELK